MARKSFVGQPHLANMTKLTREMMEGKRNPSRDMRNLKALGKEARKRAWMKRMEEEKKEKKGKAS